MKQHLSEPFNLYSPFLSFHTTLGRGFLSEFLCQPPPLGQTDTFGPVRREFIHPFSPLRDPTLNLNIPGPWSFNGNGKIAFVKDRSQFLNVAWLYQTTTTKVYSRGPSWCNVNPKTSSRPSLFTWATKYKMANISPINSRTSKESPEEPKFLLLILFDHRQRIDLHSSLKN